MFLQHMTRIINTMPALLDVRIVINEFQNKIIIVRFETLHVPFLVLNLK